MNLRVRMVQDVFVISSSYERAVERRIVGGRRGAPGRIRLIHV